MSVAQTKVKRWFDKDAKSRTFSPGDKVLVLLPIPGSALQARYSGPYVVQEKVSDQDYIVATLERQRRSRLCHINLLIPYLDRESVPLSSVSEDGKTVLVLSSAEFADEAQVAVALSSVDPAETLAASAVSDIEDVVGPSNASQM